MDKTRHSFLIALTRQLESAIHEEQNGDSEVAGWLDSLGASMAELLERIGALRGQGDDSSGDGVIDDGSDGEDDDADEPVRQRSQLRLPLGGKGPSADVPRGTSGSVSRLTDAAIQRARTPVSNITQAQLEKAVKAARLEERAKTRATSQPKSGARRGKKPKK